jgi:hypothetical protein
MIVIFNVLRLFVLGCDEAYLSRCRPLLAGIFGLNVSSLKTLTASFLIASMSFHSRRGRYPDGLATCRRFGRSRGPAVSRPHWLQTFGASVKRSWSAGTTQRLRLDSASIPRVRCPSAVTVAFDDSLHSRQLAEQEVTDPPRRHKGKRGDWSQPAAVSECAIERSFFDPLLRAEALSERLLPLPPRTGVAVVKRRRD